MHRPPRSKSKGKAKGKGKAKAEAKSRAEPNGLALEAKRPVASQPNGAVQNGGVKRKRGGSPVPLSKERDRNKAPVTALPWQPGLLC